MIGYLTTVQFVTLAAFGFALMAIVMYLVADATSTPKDEPFDLTGDFDTDFPPAEDEGQAFMLDTPDTLRERLRLHKEDKP